jgi:hypothetical protein
MTREVVTSENRDAYMKKKLGIENPNILEIDGTLEEKRQHIRNHAENFASEIEKKHGLKTSVEHSGSKAGPSSYVHISHPSDLVRLNDPFRFSTHGKGAFNNQFVRNIHTQEDIDKAHDFLKKIKPEWDIKAKEIQEKFEKNKPTKQYSEKKLKQKEEYEQKKANKSN